MREAASVPPRPVVESRAAPVLITEALIGWLRDPCVILAWLVSVSQAPMSQVECIQLLVFGCLYMSSLIEKRCLVTCMCHVA